MFCSFCGKEIQENGAFCPFCGSKRDRQVLKTEKNVYVSKNSIAPWIIVFLLLIIIGVGTYLLFFRQSDEKMAKKVVEEFFEALKAGDTSGAIECCTPATQEQYNGGLNAGGTILSILGLPNVKDLVNPWLGMVNSNYYKDYEFTVQDVVLDKENKKGTVRVDVYKNGEHNQTVMDVIKYKGKWYVE